MERSGLLLVEGGDDRHVLYAICERYSFEPEFDIQEKNGLPSLLRDLRARLKPGTSVERLGIVIDADRDLTIRWAELLAVLARVGYSELSEAPDPTGTIASHDVLPRLGVWLWPDNTAPGTLEDFLVPLVRNGDLLWTQASKSLDEATTIERRFPVQYHHKALIHTFLAWQDDPGLPMGRAVSRGFFDPNGPQIARLLDWLTRLFA